MCMKNSGDGFAWGRGFAMDVCKGLHEKSLVITVNSFANGRIRGICNLTLLCPADRQVCLDGSAGRGIAISYSQRTDG